MAAQPLCYGPNLEIIVALVTYLAKCDEADDQPDAATAQELAQRLGLDRRRVERVLTEFKGLFRESEELVESGEATDYHYSLQLRYAGRKYEDGEYTKSRPPLRNEDLFQILQFVNERVRQEAENERNRRTNTVTAVGVWVAATLSLLSVASVWLK